MGKIKCYQSRHKSHPKCSTWLKSASKEAVTTLKAKGLSSQRSSKAEEKDARRHLKAFYNSREGRGESPSREEIVENSSAVPAQQLSHPIDAKQQIPLHSQVGSLDDAREQSFQPSFSSEGTEAFVDIQSNLLPAERQWEPLPKRMKAALEATFTPMAVGLHPRENQWPEIADQKKTLISQVIAQGIVAGLQQGRQTAPVASETLLHQNQYLAFQHQRDLVTFQGSHSPPSSMRGGISLSGDEYQKRDGAFWQKQLKFHGSGPTK